MVIGFSLGIFGFMLLFSLCGCFYRCILERAIDQPARDARKEWARIINRPLYDEFDDDEKAAIAEAQAAAANSNAVMNSPEVVQGHVVDTQTDPHN